MMDSYLDHHSVKEIKCQCGVVGRTPLTMAKAHEFFLEQGWTREGKENFCPACSALNKRIRMDGDDEIRQYLDGGE